MVCHFPWSHFWHFRSPQLGRKSTASPITPVQPVAWCLWDPRGVACPRPSSHSPQTLLPSHGLFPSLCIWGPFGGTKALSHSRGLVEVAGTTTAGHGGYVWALPYLSVSLVQNGDNEKANRLKGGKHLLQFMSGSIVFLLSQYFEAVSGDPKCTKCQSCYNSFITFNSPTNDETDTSWPLQVNRGSCCLWLCRGQFYVFQFMSKQGSGERVCYFQSPERSKFACVVQDVTRQHCSNSKRKKTACVWDARATVLRDEG